MSFLSVVYYLFFFLQFFATFLVFNCRTEYVKQGNESLFSA